MQLRAQLEVYQNADGDAPAATALNEVTPHFSSPSTATLTQQQNCAVVYTFLCVVAADRLGYHSYHRIFGAGLHIRDTECVHTGWGCRRWRRRGRS